jgi:hypothetical protein
MRVGKQTINKKQDGSGVKHPDIKNLQKLAGFIKTKGRVRWSEEIDNILYGGKA